MDTERIVTNIVSAYTAKPEIALGDRLSEDLGLDSMDRVDIAMMIEENLDIELEHGDIPASIKTLGDLVNYVSHVPCTPRPN